MFRIVSELRAVARSGAVLRMADAPPSGDDHRGAPDLEAELWSQSDFYHQELQRLARQLEELRETAAERDHVLAREAELKDQLRSRDVDLQRFQEHRDQALQRVAALETCLEQEREASRKLASQRDKFMKKAKRLNKKLDALENSLSWRLTRPLRRLRALVRPKH